MLQAKENQQFNVVKENILPTDLHQTAKPIQAIKANALQPTKSSLQSVNVSNIQPHLHSIKPAGLQVSKQTGNQLNQSKNVANIVTQNTTKITLQAKPNVQQQQITKGIQSKINGQKENATNRNRQSLKPAKANEIVDGKIKKVAVPKQQNSVSKANKKSKKAIDAQKAVKKDPIKTTNPPSKPVECDFVIYCDENDELAIKAVEKENRQEENRSDENVDKKKGLVERNVKTQQNVQVDQQAKTSVQQLVAQATKVQTTVQNVQQTIINIESNVQTLKSDIELIKEAVVPINNLTLNETTLDEITLNEQSTIENKENDPTLMSIDLSKDEDMEMQVQDQHKDVSGDMYCREFSNEIYLYMLERELKFLPDPTYMNKQPEINSKMRAMLVDWLIDVGIEYELENETVFLTINYIDQFLSSLTISLQNFQLLGMFKLISFINMIDLCN